MYENFFNIHDGVIIMTEFKPRLPHDLQKEALNGIRGPRPQCEEWSDVTFQQWTAMHIADKRTSTRPEVHLDARFPPAATLVGSTHIGNVHMFDRGVVAGRGPSELRMGLDFYRQMDAQVRLQGRKFLNYIISYGDCVKDETLAVILRCLSSGDNSKAHHGKAPVFGAHETFKMGSW